MKEKKKFLNFFLAWILIKLAGCGSKSIRIHIADFILPKSSSTGMENFILA
jgi:hypothetical protein